MLVAVRVDVPQMMVLAGVAVAAVLVAVVVLTVPTELWQGKGKRWVLPPAYFGSRRWSEFQLTEGVGESNGHSSATLW